MKRILVLQSSMAEAYRLRWDVAQLASSTHISPEEPLGHVASLDSCVFNYDNINE